MSGHTQLQHLPKHFLMLEGLPLVRRFKSYVGLKGAEKKLRKYLTDFEFTDIATAEKLIDWEKVPIVRL